MNFTSSILIRAFRKSDYAEATALWQSTQGIGSADPETREAIDAFLDRTPGFSAVAVTD